LDAGGNHDPSRGGTQDQTGADATDPPAEAPVDLFRIRPLDAPSEVPLDGLRRSLRALTQSSAAAAAFLCDLSEFERASRHHKPHPVNLCGWLNQLQEMADEAASSAILLHHVSDVLWEQVSIEASDRRAAELEVARSE
jgi:hypothetical protein